MILTICLALFVQPEPVITLDLPATRLPEIAEKITEATGEQVKITGPDPGQFVFVKVEKMPFSRLRDSLSFVTGGKWTKAGDVWALQTVREDYFIEQDFRGRLQAWLNSTRRLPGLTEGLSKKEIQSLAILNRKGYILGLANEGDEVPLIRTPVQRLIARTLQLISSDLLSLKEGTRRVFALHPTSLQKPLPSQFPKLFQGFLAERAALAKFDPGDDVIGEDSDAELPESGLPPDVNQTATALLELSRMGDSLTVLLSLYDQKGRLISQPELWPLYEPIPEAKVEGLFRQDQPLFSKSILCEPPPAEEAFAAEFRKLLSSRDGLPGQKAAVTAATRSILEGQVQQDILTLNPSSLLAQVSRAAKRQAVVKLNDVALRMGILVSLSGASLSERFIALTGFSDAGFGTMKVESDLICSRPLPLVGRWALSGSGRDSAVKAIRQEAAGMSRLEVLCQIAAEQVRERNIFWPAVSSGVFTHQGPMIPLEGQAALLRVYGLLTDDQKNQAKLGGLEAALSSLRPDQQEAIWRLLLDLADESSGQVGAPGRVLSDLDKEPTVFLAGVPDAAIKIQIRLSNLPTKLIRTANGRGLPADAESIATVLYSNERNPSRKLSKSTFSGTIGTLEMKTFVGSRVVVTHTYSLHQSSPNPIEQPFSDLPSDIMKQAEEIVREWRKQSQSAPPPVVNPPSSLN